MGNRILEFTERDTPLCEYNDRAAAIGGRNKWPRSLAMRAGVSRRDIEFRQVMAGDIPEIRSERFGRGAHQYREAHGLDAVLI